jgi:hypothetical protein
MEISLPRSVDRFALIAKINLAIVKLIKNWIQWFNWATVEAYWERSEILWR